MIREDAVRAFLHAVTNHDEEGARRVLDAEPGIASENIHVAAVLGRLDDVRSLLDRDPRLVRARSGESGGDPLLWLCHSPFHGRDPDRDGALAATAGLLLDRGADPNTTDGTHGIPALHGVTGLNHVPGIARMLLEAGANPTDGESVFHAAERFHEEALDLLFEYGVDLNGKGDWGNTPLYFLLRYWDVAGMPTVRQGINWLLAHGADPGVRCGEGRENALHVAARRGQPADVVRQLIEHGADVSSPRGDGRTAWRLARRAGYDEIVRVLESAGARPESLSPADTLLAACGRGDTTAASELGTREIIGSLEVDDLRFLPEAAARSRAGVVRACIVAGFPVDTADGEGATALHHAAIQGNAAMTRALIQAGAPLELRDSQHSSTPLGWACFGVEFMRAETGDYEDTVRALLEAGALSDPSDRAVDHAGVRAVFRTFGLSP